MTHPFAPSRDVPPELQALNRSLATAAVDPQGCFLRANNRFLSLFGYEMEDLLGRHAAILVPLEEREAWLRTRPKGRIGDSWTTLARRMRRDGSPIWVRGHITPVSAADGTLIETVVILSDVSDDMERARQVGGAAAALNLSHAMAHLSPDGMVLGANDIFLALLGYRPDEIVGQHHTLFAAPSSARDEHPHEFWGGLRRGLHRTGEYRFIAKDGRMIWVQATYSPITDPSGQATRIVLYAFDITEHKDRQSEREWQIAAIDKSLAVVTFDMSGAILRANANFLEAFGYRADQIEGRHHRILVDPADVHGADYAAFWRHLRSGRHHSGQYKRIGHGGRQIWLQATYNPVFDMEGRPIQVVKYASIITDERLRQAEHEGLVAAIHKSQCVISFALDGTILDVNDNFLEVVGYRYAELLGRNHRMIAGIGESEQEKEAYRSFWRRLAKGHHQVGEYRRIGKDGREIWLHATYSPILDMDGRPFKIVKYATDITASKLRQADQQGQLQAIQKSQGVMTLGLDGSIQDANANLLEALGYRLEEIFGRPHAMLLEIDASGPEAMDELWAALRAGRFQSGLHCHVAQDGRRVWLQASYNPILDLAGKPFKIVVFATDVTENVALAEAYENARRQTQMDPATSLPNRVRLCAFMSSTLSQPGARLAVIYLDLDRFKPINDTHGHGVGDLVLGEVADRLRRHLKNDQLVARMGGDEFVIAAPGLCAEEAESLCRQLIEEISRPMRFSGRLITIGASVGVALAPGDATAVDDLLRCADAALSRAKREGGGICRFYGAEENKRLAAHRRLTDEMRRGIAKGEFFVEYQPRFETVSRRIRSVEALVRWAHPERGRVGPGEFIPLAERSGLIISLGEAVLRDACRTITALGDIGVSVNVSPVQFRDPRLVDIIASALAESGLPAERLELEITEGTLIEDAEGARHILGRLKDLGVRLAMDDFGTGYSSMSYLCDFPFDVIKIDRKFVSGLEEQGRGRAVVQAIIGLGRSLGICVTAEGVETPAQLLILTHLQCHEIQGFLLGRPMSPEALAILRDEEGRSKPDAAPLGSPKLARL